MRDTERGALDVATLIDTQPFSGLQIFAILLCAAIAFLDGVDTQSISVAAPLLAEKLKIARPALGPIFSAAALGMAIGAFTFGPLGDRFGRKRMLTLAAAVFGVFTLATAAANSYSGLLAVRMCAGFGLGGAMPCFIALASEYTPARRRATIASLIWAAFPLGGAAGGFVNAFLLGAWGWRSIFLVGGVAPLIVAALVAAFMPESIRYLAARGAPAERIARIVARLAPGAPKDVVYVNNEPPPQGSPARALFASGRAGTTLALWLAFFTGFAALGVAVLWTPTLLRDNGVSLQAASIVIGWHGVGALIGMGSAGYLVQRFGFARVLIPAFALGALVMASLGVAASSITTMTVAMVLIGLTVGMAASGCIALAALVYPTAMRATGVGWAMGTARLGQVLGPLAAGAMAGLGDVRTFYVFGAVTLLGALALGLLRLLSGDTRARVTQGVAA